MGGHLAGDALYRYTRLEDDTTQIRLLRHSRQPSREEVKFEMQAWPIGGTPTYHAISYTWGDVSKTESVIVNQIRCRIGVNAHYALLQSINQQKADVDYYWIDTLCIDQSHLLEKGHQVQMMGSIYGGSSLNYLCVGPGGPHFRLLFSVCDKYFPATSYEARKDLGSPSDKIREYVNTLPPDSEELDHLCTAMDEFMKITYIRRLWVVQEIMMGLSQDRSSAGAVQFQLHCGSCSISTGVLMA
ncbi:Hypothetical predicted protein [Lecanosticta acicola]|uniref:Heterokaryon incompatibility domain-containing protein n=1 Tax=Lecanosticta acicola TaxID=111012 RepID=A0AAI9EAH5_9PEZI|nr:Hypothetical predicted protein [Lecanosticta acicola]